MVARLSLLVWSLINFILIDTHLQNSASFSYHLFPISSVFLVVSFLFPSPYLFITVLKMQDGEKIIRHYCYPYDLSKRSLSILRSIELSLKLGILLLSRFIYLGIAGCSTSELSTRYLSMSLGIDKILDFSYSPNCLFEDTFFKDCHNAILMLKKYFSPDLFKLSIRPYIN